VAGPIGTIPQGLLSLLALKETGKNPSQLLDSVQPSFDLVQWYLTRIELTERALFGGAPSVTFASGAHGQVAFTFGGNNCVVPNNQIWWVSHMQVDGTLLAAESIRLACDIITPNISSWLAGLDYNDVVTARARDFAAFSQSGFWAPPSSIFGVRVFDVLTAATVTVGLTVRASPLLI
jgi:hypothetical protein